MTTPTLNPILAGTLTIQTATTSKYDGYPNLTILTLTDANSDEHNITIPHDYNFIDYDTFLTCIHDSLLKSTTLVKPDIAYSIQALAELADIYESLTAPAAPAESAS